MSRRPWACTAVGVVGFAVACQDDRGEDPPVVIDAAPLDGGGGTIDAGGGGGTIDAGGGGAIDAGGGGTIDAGGGGGAIDAGPADAGLPDASPPDAGCVPPAVSPSGFRPTACGDVNVLRHEHEAAALADGRVAIIGGWTRVGDDPVFVLTREVEVFDPATETFAVAGSLASGRSEHRATRLLDGRVLVTGGWTRTELGVGEITATTELFDPATGLVIAGPPMTRARATHTATLLAGGKVLVTGGYSPPDPDPESEGNKTAEVYDPLTNTFTALAAPMTVERHDHQAIRLLDGRVLITGGADAPSCCDDGIADAELFDPETSSFAVTGPLVDARPDHDLTLLADGRVLVTGGSMAHGGADGSTPIRNAEIYDPAEGLFRLTDPLNTAPGQTSTATRLADGRVLVAGGLLGDGAELYDPTTGTWSVVADTMDASRTNHTATRLPLGKVLLVGGTGTSRPGAELFVP